MNSIDEEEQKIEKWMENPVVPEWLKAHIKQPEAPNTLHYDEAIDKYVYTPTQGEVIYFDGTAEAHDDSRVDDNNTKLIGDFPDLLKDRSFGQVTTDNRMLFFGTNDQDYKTFLYRIYLCEDGQESYLEDPRSFFKSEHFISTHMLNWRIGDNPIRDYWFEDHSSISKIAVINGQNYVWQASTKVFEKSSSQDFEHTCTGKTIEEAIVHLAAEIYDTYTWEGNFKK